MSETWNAANTITVGNSVTTVEGEITADKVKDVARDNGVKNFKVEDSEGNGLNTEAFPYDGDVVVNEYNENA